MIAFKPIGTIHSPFNDIEGMPIQPAGAQGVEGTVELDPAYGDGLADLDGFSHICLIYHLHLSRGYSLVVKPFLDDTPRGLFATRAPKRPNPIGLSVVRLLRVEGYTLHVANVDVVNGTPLLDIKPYVPVFDAPQEVRLGWLTGKVDKSFGMQADDRFK